MIHEQDINADILIFLDKWRGKDYWNFLNNVIRQIYLPEQELKDWDKDYVEFTLLALFFNDLSDNCFSPRVMGLLRRRCTEMFYDLRIDEDYDEYRVMIRGLDLVAFEAARVYARFLRNKYRIYEQCPLSKPLYELLPDKYKLMFSRNKIIKLIKDKYSC